MSAAREAYYPVGLTFVAINAVAVGLRFWSRGITRAVGYDDFAMAISFVSLPTHQDRPTRVQAQTKLG